MRARNLKPGFFQNEDLIGLPFEYRLLFAGLWTLADREGRLEDRPMKIKFAIFPGDSVDCDTGLSALQDKRLIVRYSTESGQYIQVLAFATHQKPHPREPASTIPGPEQAMPSRVKVVPSPEQVLPGPALSPFLSPHSLSPHSSSLRSHTSAAPPSRDAEKVFAHWREAWNHPQAKLDAKRRKRIEARLKDFSAGQLCDAISGFRHSAWHNGTDPKGAGVVYDGIETLLRDTGQVEKGLALFANPPRAPPKAETASERILRLNGGADDKRTFEHDPDQPLAIAHG